jgi:hypothetical protein
MLMFSQNDHRSEISHMLTFIQDTNRKGEYQKQIENDWQIMRSAEAL